MKFANKKKIYLWAGNHGVLLFEFADQKVQKIAKARFLEPFATTKLNQITHMLLSMNTLEEFFPLCL